MHILFVIVTHHSAIHSATGHTCKTKTNAVLSDLNKATQGSIQFSQSYICFLLKLPSRIHFIPFN